MLSFFSRFVFLGAALLYLGAISCSNNSGTGPGPGLGPGPGPNPTPLTLSFAAANVIPSGDNPNKTQTLTVGDFDKDGDDDIATGNETTNDVRIFTSNGDGTFTQLAPINVTNTPNAITKGDFNGGGDLDLALVKANDAATVLPGPTFTPPLLDSAAIGAGPRGIVAIDLHGDTNLDLGIDTNTNLSLVINNGGLSFTHHAQTGPVTLSNPQGITAADFNGDTKNDLAVANFGSDAKVFFNSGDADPKKLFSDASSASLVLPTNSGPRGIATGDFNKDTRPDITIPNAGSDPRSVSVFINNGGVAFAPAVNYTIGTPLTSEPFDAAVGDFNKDGNLDLAITDATAINVVILLGNGDGTFQSPQAFSAKNAANPLMDDIRSIGVGDFNKDGLPDVVAASSNQNNLRILINTSK